MSIQHRKDITNYDNNHLDICSNFDVWYNKCIFNRIFYILIDQTERYIIIMSIHVKNKIYLCMYYTML